MKILFVITGLRPAGAEYMLLRLLSGLPERFDPVVVALEAAPAGLQSSFEGLGIPVHRLDMTGPASVPGAIARLTTLTRRLRPDIVSTWLYHADLIGGIAARMAGCRAIAWNIRNGDLSPSTSPAITRSIVRINARLSRRVPTRILCCSHAARRIHVALGYDDSRFEIIPNGFDLERLRPDPAARSSVRAEIGVAADTPLIGKIARFDPQKHHAGFIDGAARFARDRPDVHFVLAGSDCDASNEALNTAIRAAGLATVFHLLGRREDIDRLNAAFDISTSTAIYGEAFPNVLGEAMACGTPCVATDLGDAALIIGDTGRIVPLRDAQALADAWRELLGLSATDRQQLAEAARARVSSHFEIGTVRQRYVRAFDALLDHQQQAVGN